MAAFAEHLVAQLEHEATAEFPAVFAAVEHLLESDEAGIRYLVTYGLLEDIQNIAANRHGPAFEARFRTWLGTRGTAAWNEVYRAFGQAIE